MNKIEFLIRQRIESVKANRLRVEQIQLESLLALKESNRLVQVQIDELNKKLGVKS